MTLYQASELGVFNSVEYLNHQDAISKRSICSKSTEDTDVVRAIEIKTSNEMYFIPRFDNGASFIVVMHLKSTITTVVSTKRQNLSKNQASLTGFITQQP